MRRTTRRTAPQQTRVTAVGPGFIETLLLSATMGEEAHAFWRASTPSAACAYPGAGLVAVLAGDAATLVTSSYHPVGCGYTAQEPNGAQPW